MLLFAGCGTDLQGSCAHDRGAHYFVESINSSLGFIGKKCVDFKSVTASGCNYASGTKRMAGEPIQTGSGIYYVETYDKVPFAKPL